MIDGVAKSSALRCKQADRLKLFFKSGGKSPNLKRKN
jgi:hypothetical protein